MPEEIKRLYRSKTQRILFGVCGGLGDFLNTDPTIIRVLAVVLCVLSMGAGIVGYIIMALIVPESRDEKLP
jgi:phage shock protein C